MTLIRHELKQAWKALLIWTLSIGAFVVICLFMYPEMKSQMNSISSIFASMGAFSSAFGLDTLDFGSLKGFYGIECGNILGIGGALFAALLAKYPQLHFEIQCPTETYVFGQDTFFE